VYEKQGFVREGLRRMQYRSGDVYRDEVLMAWFPDAAPAHETRATRSDR
jgi:RimJ/RimL family protein N-acetyltransferase